jgi:hypothetical protein
VFSVGGWLRGLGSRHALKVETMVSLEELWPLIPRENSHLHRSLNLETCISQRSYR